MLIRDDLFDAFLDCKTKAHLRTSLIAATHPDSHPISEWRWHVAEQFKHKCGDLLISAAREGYFVGTPPPQDLTNATHHLILDPIVRSEHTESHIHALERIVPNQKPYNCYIPIRFTPSEKINKHHKLLLAFDAFVLWQASGQMPLFGKLIHGMRQTAVHVKLSTLIIKVDSIVQKLHSLLAARTTPDLVLIRHCRDCEFEGQCRSKAIEKDDLSLLDRFPVADRAKYNAKGIFTVTQLAYTFRPRRRPKRLAARKEKYHHALKALAIRDHKIHVAGNPQLALTGTPVYLDVEGVPERDFYYLIGVRIQEGSSIRHFSFWADDLDEEKQIWLAFLRVLERVNNPVVLHYGAYEATFLKRLEQRYDTVGYSSGLLKTVREQSINLLSTIYSQIYFPTYSNGLKDIARCLGFQWSDPAASGLQSIIWRQQWEETHDETLKQKLITYNREDCEALQIVAKATDGIVGGMKREERDSGPAEINGIGVQSEGVQDVSKWRRFDSSVTVLEAINEAAHWDYQRDRVYVRSSGWRAKPNRVTASARTVKPHINKVVKCETPRRCPLCKTKLAVGKARSKVVYDLRFGRASVRRWIVKYVFQQCECPRCGGPVHAVGQTWGRGKYGWNLISFLVYEIVELCVPQRTTTRNLNRLFHMSIPRSSACEQKRRASQYYADARQRLLKQIVDGPLIHVDETPISTSGKRSFVWVFCNFHEVVYFYSESREAGMMHGMLRDFKGVLVSDFYSAYDSLECPQQKCLIHLIRDLNNEMLSSPYDEELRWVVQTFGDLLKPIIDTIDRYGLKKHFLRKHVPGVQRFNEWLSNATFRSEAAEKCKERFEKNRNKLFTFLSYDGVPWNNNNAEHAVKAFAAIRDVAEGITTPRGIEEYLILLSVCESCRYQNIDFLEFLCSREKYLDEFVKNS